MVIKALSENLEMLAQESLLVHDYAMTNMLYK
jgi:hypothetical protein